MINWRFELIALVTDLPFYALRSRYWLKVHSYQFLFRDLDELFDQS